MTDILVLGGTGKVGRRLARHLRDTGRKVRKASRSGCDVRVDLDDPETWAPALDGITAAYLVEPDLQACLDGRGHIPGFVAEAVSAGVRRLVLLSAPGAETDESLPLWSAERAVRGSGVDWTILQPTWFAQNFSEAMFLPGVLSGTLSPPTGDGRVPFVDAEDIAEVAASALTEDGHSGQVYELTGPRSIGFGEAADLIARATGRTIRYVDVDPEVYVEQQVAAGVPAGAARLLADLLSAVRDGHGAELADGVQRALDRPPRPFENYVTETAAAGHWS